MATDWPSRADGANRAARHGVLRGPPTPRWRPSRPTEGRHPLPADAASRNRVSEAEARARAAELRALGKNGDYFFSLNRYLFLAGKPDAP